MIISKSVKTEESTENLKCNLSLKDSFYKKNEKTIHKELCILNFITNDKERKNSTKTFFSDTPPDTYNYELCMINKYDENLDQSLSFISDFNLEEDEKELNDSFKSSSDNDNNDLEKIEIKVKSTKNVCVHKFDDENDPEFEKEFEDIKNFLLTKRLSK